MTEVLQYQHKLRVLIIAFALHPEECQQSVKACKTEADYLQYIIKKQQGKKEVPSRGLDRMIENAIRERLDRLCEKVKLYSKLCNL